MKNLLKKIFGSTDENKSQLKERPKDWNLTISDLMNELNNGKRKQLNEPELTWAREYERSLIPSSYRFPRKGDLYQSKEDQEIEFLTAWSAPYTGGGKAILLEGEKIWIDSDPIEKEPIGAYALPVDYAELELRMVSSSERDAGKYNGFYLSVDTKVLNEKFDLIEENFEKEK